MLTRRCRCRTTGTSRPSATRPCSCTTPATSAIMTTYNTSRPADHLKPELAGHIAAAWGSPTGLLDALRAAGASVFGSGWAWLVYLPDAAAQTPPAAPLAIVTTPNQDNPLMAAHVARASRGVPLLGVDVWEHAYYLRYRNLRTTYLAQWVSLVDWAMVQRNYDLAVAGAIDSLYC
ncbi:Superoxide dismutase [Mn], mitochondrial [Tetrabaena socialis]|uniref:superoxide dismutase n=1 Tax=Tetrabaena socialis TaxID=47790 RepID=A0A2J8ADA2_9CHLO|nr:Superoxide dismutase [Mn], mitochondrial [Tetrabaena socialis]|eukprot:PNH10494.1 Superoxide dismutase [Mn], mitochondrial [Tetrabaena socialis]